MSTNALYSIPASNGIQAEASSTGFNAYNGGSAYQSTAAYWSGYGASALKQSQLYNRISSFSSTQKGVRPSMPTVVTPWFTIIKTMGLSTNGVLSITGLMVLGWMDPRLAWDLANDTTTQLNLNVDDIWYPPLTMVNSATPDAITPGSSVTAQVYYTGLVYLYIPSLFTSTCTLNLNLFPYDRQTCILRFTSLDSNTTAPGVTFSAPDNSALPLNLYSMTGEFTLNGGNLTTAENLCVSSCFSSFIIILNYARRSSFYTMTVVIPLIMLTFLLALTLVIPSENYVKITVACTLMVSLYTLQQTVARLLPASDSAPLLAIGTLCSLALATFCVVGTIISVVARMLQPRFGPRCGSWLDQLTYLICQPQKRAMLMETPEYMMETVLNLQPSKLSAVFEQQDEKKFADLNGSFTQEESLTLKNIEAHLALLTRSSRDAAAKKAVDGELNHRWRIMDASSNLLLVTLYLAAAIACMLLFYSPT